MYKYILGFMNYCSHDPGACLSRVNSQTGEVKYIFAEEGFLSRVKKSYQFPTRSIKYCLDYFEITISEIDALCLDFMDAKQSVRTSHNYRLLVGDFIRSHLNLSPDTQTIFAESHHLAHAYSAFYASSFKDAAVVVVDGVGSQQQTQSIFYFDITSHKLISQQQGTGIGTLYTLVTSALGFEAGEEGKTMGLAPYGLAYNELDSELPDFSGFYKDNLTDYSHLIDRNPSAKLKFNFPRPSTKEDLYTPFYSRIAFNLQKECESALEYLFDYVKGLELSDNICFAGGVALNCVANELISSIASNNIFIQPAAGDTGIPFGLSLIGAEKLSSVPISLSSEHFFSSSKSQFLPYTIDCSNTINNVIDNFSGQRISEFISDYSSNGNPEIIAELLQANLVGCLYHSSIEIGPRALGHRSFIASAATPSMKETMNLKIKHREPYRPFAPIILEEHFSDYFTGNCMNIYRYMLGASCCTDLCKLKAPAIVHHDNTARVQSITSKNGFIHQILSSYYELTSSPILINTSFNDNNEPIVFSHLDAILCFLRTNADFLVIDDSLILRSALGNVNDHLKSLSALQSSWSKHYMSLALSELTTISSSNISLESFVQFNLELTKANRSTLPFTKLIDYLCSLDSTIYTDEYHKHLLELIASLFPAAFSNIQSRTIVVSDDLFGLQSLPSSCSCILYNLTPYLGSTRDNFYTISDKKLPDSLKGLGHEGHSSGIDNLKAIMLSYEVDPEKTIDSFFADYVN